MLLQNMTKKRMNEMKKVTKRKIVMSQLKAVKGKKALQISSMVINIVAVMFLALTRETYATVLIFLLFLMKGILAVKGRVLDI